MAVDMWALGVCVYALISGYLPFDEMEPPEPGCTIEWVVEFPDEQWVDVSEDAKDLIRRLLEPNPMRRYTARQVLQHPVRVCVFVRACLLILSFPLHFYIYKKLVFSPPPIPNLSPLTTAHLSMIIHISLCTTTITTNILKVGCW